MTNLIYTAYVNQINFMITDAQQAWTNWSGDVSFLPAGVEKPANEQELEKIIHNLINKGRSVRMVSETTTILSAMITPVVLIVACGSLILTTSQRLNRSIERTRKLTSWIKAIAETDQNQLQDEISMQCDQLQKSTRRARLLQKAMTALYLSLSVFVATSISIAIVDIYKSTFAWIPMILGIVGASLMFYASVLLIKESRIAITAVNLEMDNAISFVQSKFSGLGAP